MIIISNEGLDELLDMAYESGIGARVLPFVLERLIESSDYSVELDYRGLDECGVGRTSWFKGVKALRKRGVVVHNGKGKYVIHEKFIKKDPAE